MSADGSTQVLLQDAQVMISLSFTSAAIWKTVKFVRKVVGFFSLSLTFSCCLKISEFSFVSAC